MSYFQSRFYNVSSLYMYVIYWLTSRIIFISKHCMNYPKAYQIFIYFWDWMWLQVLLFSSHIYVLILGDDAAYGEVKTTDQKIHQNSRDNFFSWSKSRLFFFLQNKLKRFLQVKYTAYNKLASMLYNGDLSLYKEDQLTMLYLVDRNFSNLHQTANNKLNS